MLEHDAEVACEGIAAVAAQVPAHHEWPALDGSVIPSGDSA
jgi:hypothetical protein